MAKLTNEQKELLSGKGFYSYELQMFEKISDVLETEQKKEEDFHKKCDDIAKRLLKGA